MGYSGKLKEKLRAQELRAQGLSYLEIHSAIPVSKNTISRWCRDIPLTDHQIARLLSNKLLGQRKGSLIAAENKRRRRIYEIQSFAKSGQDRVGTLSSREFFVSGLAYYSAEGGKGEYKVEFANTDPKIISFMMRWFLAFLEVPIVKFRGALWLHEGLDEMAAKIFWSQLTNIPLLQFHKTYMAKNKIGSSKIRKNIHKFGVFSIRISDSQSQRMIKGWISGLLAGRISLVP